MFLFFTSASVSQSQNVLNLFLFILLCTALNTAASYIYITDALNVFFCVHKRWTACMLMFSFLTNGTTQYCNFSILGSLLFTVHIVLLLFVFLRKHAYLKTCVLDLISASSLFLTCSYFWHDFSLNVLIKLFL